MELQLWFTYCLNKYNILRTPPFRRVAVSLSYSSGPIWQLHLLNLLIKSNFYLMDPTKEASSPTSTWDGDSLRNVVFLESSI